MTNETADVSKKVKTFSIKLLLVLVVFLLCSAVFFFIVNVVVIDKQHSFDHHIFQLIEPYRNELVTQLMSGITFLGSTAFLLPAYTFLVVYFLTFGKNKKLAFNIAVIGISSRLIQSGAKLYFQRQRPTDPIIQNVDGFSFPSGHSFSGFTFFGLLIYIIWQLQITIYLRWLLSVLCFLFAAAIAFSRVYLKVHYASDVIAGFCLGVIWLILSFWLLNKLNFLK